MLDRLESSNEDKKRRYSALCPRELNAKKYMEYTILLANEYKI